ncbi:GMC oxidoreductase [Pedobacter namyangjuensis]|uniref:GMC oxidoreductase n=1 Tax=Pedobacter namyangjuensis TaxID=600626 RepID=UPI000DE3C725|nr:GMC family oxidoreductase [Pedobacter namyangjuensis]
MIFNFNDFPEEIAQKYDICIVGTGAASLAMLSQLLDNELTILVLEAGGEYITEKNQDQYKTINKVHPFPGALDGRFRVFGGSTTKWGAQSLPLEKIDFIERDWINNSGWPISYNEVFTFYSKVDSFLQLYPVEYAEDISTINQLPKLQANTNISLKFSKWSAKPDLRESFREQLIKSENVTLIQNANVVNINLFASGDRVESLTCVNLEKKEFKFSAKRFVLACGGIENARLLLASNNQMSNGIGNQNGMVGRYLQDHPNAHIATLHAKDDKAQAYFNYFYINGTRFLPRFVFSEKFQRDNLILNSSAYFSFITDENDLFSIIKDFYRKYRRRSLVSADFKIIFKVLKNMPHLFKIGYSYAIKKRVYTPNAVLKLNLMTEATPLSENRICLSKEVDQLGMPRAIINWEGDELMRQTFIKSAEFLKKYFDKLDLGKLELDDWIYDAKWFDHIKDAKHHIGTTRMATDEYTGVVDSNCRVFGIDNLYIAGSSVFPTSGHSNPTTTIIALAFRLADHLKNNKHD